VKGETTIARRLPPKQEGLIARRNALASIIADVAEADVELVRAAGLAKRLRNYEEGELLLNQDDAAIEKAGWTREELQIATDAKRTEKEVPYYVKMAQRRFELRTREASDAKPAMAVQVVLPPPVERTREARDNAPVIDVTALGGEKP